MSNMIYAICLAVAVGVLGFLGGMDYKDEQAQALHCKNMVAAGVWPEEVCK